MLLDNLLRQTRVPDEIVLTDGGSVDKTTEIIESYARKGLPVRLIRERGALPGRGRNLAAAAATSEWLAFIDAGIRPEAGWLEALAARAARDAATDVVYGSWQPVTDSFFKQCAAMAYVPPPTREVEGHLMRPRFIASSLMRREVWQRAAVFPEHLRSAEDLLFMNEVERMGARIAYEPRALVRWDIQPNLARTFRRFGNYSRHNIRAGLWKDWQAAIFRRYALVGLTALPALVFGWRWLWATLALWLLLLAARGVAALRRQRRVFPLSMAGMALRLPLLMLIIFVLDAAALWGSVKWLVKDKLGLAGEGVGVRNGA